MQPEVLNEWVTLYNAACEDVLPTLDSINCVITDPPYGINLREASSGGRHGRRRTAVEHSIIGDESTQIGQFVLDWCETNDLPTVAFASPRLPWKGTFSSLLVWDKGGAVGGGGDVERTWKQSWELIQVARTGLLNGGRDTSVLKYHVTHLLSINHPAAKPVNLLSYLIEKTTDEGHTILDPFAGSGTTGIAAMLTGRKCILIEKDAKYCDVIRKRVRDADAASPGKLFDPANDTSLFAEQVPHEVQK